MDPGDSRTITAARPEDLPPLAELMAASPLLQRYGTTRESALVALEHASQKEDILLVAREPGGALAGLAWVIGSRALTRAAYLRLLLVAGNRQGAGVGERLLAAAEGSARESANHLFLLTTTDNGGARRFYERCGYQHVGNLPEFAVPAIDEALYHKVLRPHGDRLPA